MIEASVDLGVLHDLLVERYWMSTAELSFDEASKTFTMTVGDRERRWMRLVEIESGGFVERMRLTVLDVGNVDVRDDADIEVYDTKDVRQQGDVLTFESNFPFEIELKLEPGARMRIESLPQS